MLVLVFEEELRGSLAYLFCHYGNILLHCLATILLSFCRYSTVHMESNFITGIREELNMNELATLLDKIEKESRTRAVKEALNAYLDIVEMDMSLGKVLEDRVKELYMLKDPCVHETRHCDNETHSNIRKLLKKRRQRVLELLGISEVIKDESVEAYFYLFGKGHIPYENLINLLTQEVWECYYAKKKASVNIQAIKRTRNAFLLSFDT